MKTEYPPFTTVNAATIEVVDDLSQLPNGNYCTGGPNGRFGGFASANVQPLKVYFGGPNNPTKAEFDKLVMTHLQQRLVQSQVDNLALNVKEPELGKVEFDRSGVCFGTEADYTLTLEIKDVKFRGGSVSKNGSLTPGDGYEIFIVTEFTKDPHACVIS